MRGTKILVATFLGFIAGIVCYSLARRGGPTPSNMVWSII